MRRRDAPALAVRGDAHDLGDRAGPGEDQPRLSVGGPRRRRLPRRRDRLPRDLAVRRAGRRGRGRAVGERDHRRRRAARRRAARTAANLAVRGRLAARRLRRRRARRPAARHASGIPVAGGMAGGSADAAGRPGGLRRALADRPVPRPMLQELAAGLGSDVPFSLVGGTALGTGRGERPDPGRWPGAGSSGSLAIADGGLSTPEVYAECDRLRRDQVLPEPRVPDSLMAALRSGDARSPSGARPCGRRCRLGRFARGRRDRAAGRRPRPGSGARRSASPSSPGWPRRTAS